MDISKPVRNVADDPVQSTGAIDKLGLGGEVLRLRRMGMSIDAIAKETGFNKGQVQEWINRHDNLPEQGRQAIADRSIFNVAHHLEIQFERLLALLETLDQKGKHDLQLMGFGEVRQFLNFAATITEKLYLIQQQEKLKEAILEEIDQEAPGMKARILRRLADKRDYFSVIKPY